MTNDGALALWYFVMFLIVCSACIAWGWCINKYMFLVNIVGLLMQSNSGESTKAAYIYLGAVIGGHNEDF